MQPIANYKCVTGEGPLWHPDEGLLYWIDIPLGCLYRYDPNDGSKQKVLQAGEIGGFTIQEDGSLLLFMDKGSIKILKNGRSKEASEKYCMSIKDIISLIPEVD